MTITSYSHRRSQREFGPRVALVALAALLVLAGFSVALAESGGESDPKALVAIFADSSAIQPGKPFDVALQFTIEEPWHIYWRNAGDAGMPPSIDWKLPEGFSASEFRFPIPNRHVDQAELTTFIHEGKPVLLTTITPPVDLEGQGSVTLGGDLKWLVCDKQCLLEQGAVALKLPVAQSDADAKPAHEALFARARKGLPVVADQAKWVTLKPTLGKGKLAPEQKFEIHLEVDIKKGVHIQSNRPLMEGLIATDVIMAPADNVYFDFNAVYPEPSLRDAPQLGRGAKVSEFGGKITIRVSGDADEELIGASRTLGGLFIYQACDDKKGTCFPKEAVEWSIEVPIGMAAASGASTGDSPTGVAGTTGASSDDGVFGQSSVEVEKDGLEALLHRLGLPGLLVGCFLYGLFINATPCVLPVLSIKVLGFVQQAHHSRGRTALLGITFGLGVILFYIPLGLLAASGTNVLQYPEVVIALCALITAFALSMMGVFSLQPPSSAMDLEANLKSESLVASFVKGALAPILGFACTGPFMAGFFGIAAKQPQEIAIASFAVVGLGMASPYMILGANPSWLKFVPKPGQWMITFERVMGFLLLAMVIWLMHPLMQQLGPAGFEGTLFFLIAVAFGCYILGLVSFTMSKGKRWLYRLGAAAIPTVSGFLIYGVLLVETPQIVWQKWSPEAVRQSVEDGHIVFVDFTAAYCTVCKANKKIAINTEPVLKRVSELDVQTYQGDYTNQDERIHEMLQRYDRLGVPLNLIYSPGAPDNPIVLDTSLTKEYVAEMLDLAAKRSKDSPGVVPATNLASARAAD
jgi:thiol:disulfide interchange protein DsbD